MSDANEKLPPQGGATEETEYEFEYDRGGVPLFLVLLYLTFLLFSLFYALDFLVPSWGSLEQHIEP